jgi:superfamily II DNA/RNA helicase
MTITFAQLGLPEPLVGALAKRDITEPFPVQAATIPDALRGLDVSGEAPTGSGKTLAFGLPLLTRVEKAKSKRPRALILAPTRELAEQIRTDLAPMGKTVGRWVGVVYGGVSYGPQKGALRKGVDVLVATPGRLEDLIEQRALSLGDVDIVVVDEADRMADMGFMPAVRRILDATATKRQTLLFSATLDGDIAILSRDYQINPVRHNAPPIDPKTIDVRHHFWHVKHHDRVGHTAEIVNALGKSIVFTRTRHGADRLAKQLARTGVQAVAMHGGRSQAQRNRALKDFATGRAQALIATDVAARGIHVDAVDSVIHFDPPADSKDYVHRSGRTARAGATGIVVSLVTGEQKRAAQRLQRDLKLNASLVAPEVESLKIEGQPRKEHVTSRPTGPAPSDRSSRRAPRGRGDTQSIYVANLPWKATGKDIEGLFSEHGLVHDATVISNRRTGRSKGFGFVEMPSKSADVAVKALQGATLGGRDLTVRIATPEPPRWKS